MRTVYAAYDGGRWVFGAHGTQQPFEEVAAYQARRIRDRFTSEMLERYRRALGVEVFEPGSYGPGAVLVESTVVMPPNPRVMTLDQAQRWLDVVPGTADALPG